MRTSGDWKLAAKLLAAAPAEIEKAAALALAQEAEFLAGKVKERLRKGPHTPLSPLTLAGRRLKKKGKGAIGTKPLIATGDLFGSVAAIKVGDGWFIGVSRSAKRDDGQDPVRLAEIHEKGQTIVIEVTDKMRKFFFGVLLPLVKGSGGGGGNGGFKRGILVIRIPARPFIQPVFDEFAPTAVDRMAARLAKLLPAFSKGGA